MPSLTPRLDSLQNVNNLIINGNMDFSQRYPSKAAAATGDFITDRFQLKANSSTGVVTISQDSDAPTVLQSGFPSSKSAKVLITTADTSIGTTEFYTIQYRMEGYDYASIHGRPFLVSFWVKTNLAGTYTVGVRNSSESHIYVSAIVVAADEVGIWVKKSIRVSATTSGTWNFDNSIGLVLNITLMAGSDYYASTLDTWLSESNKFSYAGQANLAASVNNYFQVTQVMICDATYLPPDADLPFKRAGKTIGDEFNLCQRYYQIVSISQYRPLGVFRGTGSTSQSNHIGLPVTMRATPTSVSKSLTIAYWATLGAAHTSSGASTLSIGGVNPSTISFNCPLVAVNNVSYIFANYSAATTMELTAEL